MQVTAQAKGVRISTRKVRLVADAIRDMEIDQALQSLKVTHKRAADVIEKTLQSAIANAVSNANLDRNKLMIESIIVTEGQALKRFRPSTRGRIHPYKRRSSHLRIVLREKGENK